ncbi:MAG TPA: hypothetical protein VKU37_02260 [Verrucomicrobiae bacterium]|nr:hypothetical protein [Verrucomicrobiae bacterium]
MHKLAFNNRTRFTITKTILPLIVAALLVGCEKVPDQSSTELENRVATIETEINAMQTAKSNSAAAINYLNTNAYQNYEDITNLYARVQSIEFQNLFNNRHWIKLDPTSKSYQPIDTSLMPLLVSVEDLTPYLDGYKVKIQIGNPYSMEFNGLHISCKWGIPLKYNSNTVTTNYTEYVSSQKTKEYDQPEALYSGQWNTVELTIIPATAEEIQNVTISIAPNQIILRQPVTE